MIESSSNNQNKDKVERKPGDVNDEQSRAEQSPDGVITPKKDSTDKQPPDHHSGIEPHARDESGE